MEHNFLFSLSWLDWTLLTILAVSVAWGCFRGLLRTVVSLTALFVSAFLAIRFGEAAAEVWPPMPGRQGFAHAAVFFGVYILIRVIGALLIHLAHLAGLRGLDLAAGGAFGALRGVALSFLLVLGMSGLGFAKTSSWQQSILPPYLGEGRARDIRAIPADSRLGRGHPVRAAGGLHSARQLQRQKHFRQFARVCSGGDLECGGASAARRRRQPSSRCARRRICASKRRIL